MLKHARWFFIYLILLIYASKKQKIYISATSFGIVCYCDGFCWLSALQEDGGEYESILGHPSWFVATVDNSSFYTETQGEKSR